MTALPPFQQLGRDRISFTLNWDRNLKTNDLHELAAALKSCYADATIDWFEHKLWIRKHDHALVAQLWRQALTHDDMLANSWLPIRPIAELPCKQNQCFTISRLSVYSNQEYNPCQQTFKWQTNDLVQLASCINDTCGTIEEYDHELGRVDRGRIKAKTRLSMEQQQRQPFSIPPQCTEDQMKAITSPARESCNCVDEVLYGFIFEWKHTLMSDDIQAMAEKLRTRLGPAFGIFWDFASEGGIEITKLDEP